MKLVIGGGYFSVKQKYNLLGKYVILGVAAIWDKRKGLDDFVKLSKLLDERYKVILVGLTGEQIKALPDAIIGMERTNSVAELAELYAMADVFVNPTYEDNYPTTNLEAISCGTPVITYNTGGSPESVPKQNVVPKGDFLSVYTLINGEISCSDIPSKTKSDVSMEYIKIINLGREN